jgi:hypothetical protein
MPQQPPQVAKATLTAMPSGTPLEVHFNPASMVYSVENSVAQQAGLPKKAQYVAQFSGKLTMDLQFDSTDTGSDVRIYTNKVAMFMQATGTAQAAAANSAPPSSNGGTQSAPPKAPPVLQFQWGSYTFQGIMDSFKETIDFFSADGIALRALVSIGLSRQDQVFDEGQNLSGPTTAGSLVPSSASDSALSVATRGGDPSAARQLGTDNGLESLRFTGGASLQVSVGTASNAPAGFANAVSGNGGGASLGISASAAAGASGGGASSALGARFGASASAGVSASAGAFAGLQSGRTSNSSTRNLDPQQMLPATVSADVATFGGATYSLGGAARSAGSSGLSTNVGATFSFSDRLTFSSDD